MTDWEVETNRAADVIDLVAPVRNVIVSRSQVKTKKYDLVQYLKVPNTDGISVGLTATQGSIFWHR